MTDKQTYQQAALEAARIAANMVLNVAPEATSVTLVINWATPELSQASHPGIVWTRQGAPKATDLDELVRAAEQLFVMQKAVLAAVNHSLKLVRSHGQSTKNSEAAASDGGTSAGRAAGQVALDSSQGPATGGAG